MHIHGGGKHRCNKLNIEVIFLFLLYVVSKDSRPDLLLVLLHSFDSFENSCPLKLLESLVKETFCVFVPFNHVHSLNHFFVFCKLFLVISPVFHLLLLSLVFLYWRLVWIILIRLKVFFPIWLQALLTNVYFEESLLSLSIKSRVKWLVQVLLYINWIIFNRPLLSCK